MKRLLAHRIKPLRRHLCPPLEVIFCHGGAPRCEQRWIGGRQDCRSVLLRKASDFAQQFPIARYRDLRHASLEKGIECFDMQRARRAGHLRSSTTINWAKTMFSPAVKSPVGVVRWRLERIPFDLIRRVGKGALSRAVPTRAQPRL